jgi:hypothetical protein
MLHQTLSKGWCAPAGSWPSVRGCSDAEARTPQPKPGRYTSYDDDHDDEDGADARRFGLPC